MLIILSLSIKIKFEKKIIFIRFEKKFIFLIIGIVHGLTNSGGTILSLFLSALNKSFKIIKNKYYLFLFIVSISTIWNFFNII